MHLSSFLLPHYSLLRQVGVFVSRTSALWCAVPSLSVLWLMPLVQCGLLTLFTIEGATGHPLKLAGVGLLVPAAIVRVTAAHSATLVGAPRPSPQSPQPLRVDIAFSTRCSPVLRKRWASWAARCM